MGLARTEEPPPAYTMPVVTRVSYRHAGFLSGQSRQRRQMVAWNIPGGSISHEFDHQSKTEVLPHLS